MGDALLPKGFKKTELGHFPEDWDIQICSALSERIMVGIVIRPSQYYVKFGIPALRSANIRENGINNSDLVFISEKSNALLAKSQTRQGDVLTVRTGYPGTSAVVHSSHAGCNCIDILITRPSRKICSEYLAIWVNSPFGKDQVLKNQGGLAQQHFNVGDMKNLVVALPKLAEQRAIATALSDIDALIAGLDQLIGKKRALKQAAMQNLLTGQKRLPGFETKMGYKKSEIGIIPEDWGITRLGKLIHSVEYGSSSKSNAQGKIPVLRMGNIQDGKIDWSDLVFTSDDAEIGRYMLRDRDVLFNRTNTIDLVGKTAIYRGEGPAIFAGYLIRININPSLLDPSFLNFILNAEFSKKHGTQVLSVAVGQANINGQKLKSYPIPLPPTKAEQEAIAKIIVDMESELTALEQRRDKTRLLKQGMMQELLTGRIRLVAPAATAAAPQAVARTKSLAAS